MSQFSPRAFEASSMNQDLHYEAKKIDTFSMHLHEKPFILPQVPILPLTPGARYNPRTKIIHSEHTLKPLVKSPRQVNRQYERLMDSLQLPEKSGRFNKKETTSSQHHHTSILRKYQRV